MIFRFINPYCCLFMNGHKQIKLNNNEKQPDGTSPINCTEFQSFPIVVPRTTAYVSPRYTSYHGNIILLPIRFRNKLEWKGVIYFICVRMSSNKAVDSPNRGWFIFVGMQSNQTTSPTDIKTDPDTGVIWKYSWKCKHTFDISCQFWIQYNETTLPDLVNELASIWTINLNAEGILSINNHFNFFFISIMDRAGWSSFSLPLFILFLSLPKSLGFVHLCFTLRYKQSSQTLDI